MAVCTCRVCPHVFLSEPPHWEAGGGGKVGHFSEFAGVFPLHTHLGSLTALCILGAPAPLLRSSLLRKFSLAQALRVLGSFPGGFWQSVRPSPCAPARLSLGSSPPGCE